MHRNVVEFARWFLAQPFSALRPPKDGIYEYVTAGGTVHGVVLHREAPWQVELFSVAPGRGGFFPEHGHPHVDSIEVLLGGEIAFTRNGRRVSADEEVFGIASDGASPLCGAQIRVRPGVPHGASLGSAGAMFLSIQHWLDGVPPTSVGLDWDGPPHTHVRRR